MDPDPQVPPDPRTVLDRFSELKVSSTRVTEPITPRTDSPRTLDKDTGAWIAKAIASCGNPAATTAKLYAKLLVSNAGAGSIIGKAGGNINDFQQRTYARIQLSKSGDYYPGTAERTLLVTGRIKQIIAALELIFEKLLREGAAPLSPRTRETVEAEAGMDPDVDGDPTSPSRLLIRMLVPAPLCGIIIGKSGTTVRTISTETNTQIRVTAPFDASAMQLGHRVVTINGTPECVLKAIASLVLKQSEDPKFSTFADLPASYSSAAPGVPVSHASLPPYGVPPHAGLALPGMPYLHQPHPQFQHHLQYPNVPQPAGHASLALPPYGAPPPYLSVDSDGWGTLTMHLLPDHAALLSQTASSTGVGHQGLEELGAAAAVQTRLEDSLSNAVGSGKPRFKVLTVTGVPENVHYAYMLVSQRLTGAMMVPYYAPTPAAAAPQPGTPRDWGSLPGYRGYQALNHTYVPSVYGAGRASPLTLTPRQVGEPP